MSRLPRRYSRLGDDNSHVVYESKLEELASDIDAQLMDWLEEVAVGFASEMNRTDRLNVAHDTIITQRRKKTVAVGPSKDGRRGHLVRFHEYGTVHHGATPLMRPVMDQAGAVVRAKVGKAVKRTAEARKLAGR